jgi:four helix bundle protein
MNQQEMKKRTKEYAKRIIKLCRALPNTLEGRRISDQLFRAGTSVGANIHAACRGRSKAEFVSKLGVTLEETDESLYWMKIITETKQIEAARFQSLLAEGNELVAIMVSSINTAKRSK